MKKILAICLCLLQCTSAVQAKSASTILLYGDALSTTLLLTIHENNEIDVLSLPNNLVLPITCANKNAALWTITSEASSSCLTSTLQQTFQLSIDHTLYLHTKAIDQDFPQKLKGSDLKNMDDITTYFEYLAEQSNVSMLWKYQDYIATDMSLWELKDFYPLFTNDSLQMKYQYLHLIGNQGYWFALDRNPYPIQK